MNLQQDNKNQRNYRYAFDLDGYYMGIVRPTGSSAIGTPLYPELSTDQEPYWKEGFVPRYDFKFKNWILEKREKKEQRQNLEDELTEKIISIFIEHSNKKFDFHLKKYLEKEEVDTKRFQILRLAQDRTDIKIERVVLQHSSDIKDLIERLLNNNTAIMESLRLILDRLYKPTLWQRIKAYFKF